MRRKSTVVVTHRRNQPDAPSTVAELMRARPLRLMRKELVLEGINLRNRDLPTEMLPHLRTADAATNEQAVEVLCERQATAAETAIERVRSFGRPQRPTVPNTFAAPAHFSSHAAYLNARGLSLHNHDTAYLMPRQSITPDETYYRQTGFSTQPRATLSTEATLTYTWQDGATYSLELPTNQLVYVDTLRNWMRNGFARNGHTDTAPDGSIRFPVDLGYHLGSQRIEWQWTVPTLVLHFSAAFATSVGCSGVQDWAAHGDALVPGVLVALSPEARPEWGPPVNLVVHRTRNLAFATDYGVPSHEAIVARNKWRVVNARGTANARAAQIADVTDYLPLDPAIMRRAAEIAQCAQTTKCLMRELRLPTTT